MKPDEAIERLERMAVQVRDGRNFFREFADCIRELQAALEKFEPKPEAELTDDSPMPFGCHKGKVMSSVPASYLHWFWNEGKAGVVRDYIEKNLVALKREYPDGIW